jgi:hypothetical protein
MAPKIRTAITRSLFAGPLRFLPILVMACVNVHAQTTTDRIDTLLTKWNQKDGPGMAALLIRDGPG